MDPENELNWNTASSNYDQVPEALLNEYSRQLETGFHIWTKDEYNTFLQAYLEHGSSVLSHIDFDTFTKSKEEVQRYLDVFVVRYEEAGAKKFID